MYGKYQGERAVGSHALVLRRGRRSYGRAACPLVRHRRAVINERLLRFRHQHRDRVFSENVPENTVNPGQFQMSHKQTQQNTGFVELKCCNALVHGVPHRWLEAIVLAIADPFLSGRLDAGDVPPFDPVEHAVAGCGRLREDNRAVRHRHLHRPTQRDIRTWFASKCKAYAESWSIQHAS